MLPAVPLAFVATGPHPWWVALAVLPAPLLFVGVDRLSGTAQESDANEEGNGWPFDLLLVLHALLHFAMLAGYLRLAGRVGVLSADFWVGAVLVGHNTGWSSIIVAHELIHRRSRWARLLGRALLCTALYDHFAIEHVRGHHVRVGTGGDPATARFGETLTSFKWRTIPGQFRSAWRIECRRLGNKGMPDRAVDEGMDKGVDKGIGDSGMPWWDPRLLRNHVARGLAVEIALAVIAGLAFGPAAVAALLVQAWQAINLLETVNYFEHWGLSRASRRVTTRDSWDTDSTFTRFALIGLARHADHHAHPTRAFQALQHVEESPKLPYGYPPMVLLAQVWNSRFQRLMTEELRRRGLGPFAAPAESPAE
jgi:alkane 1-monooxygenase